jgi:hypothetical protein
MTAFDTDVLTEILAGNNVYVARASQIPAKDQAIPVIVAEEITICESQPSAWRIPRLW